METDHVKDTLNKSKKTEKGFREVIDCSLQSKDFVSELSAEIDLDETGEFDGAEEKGSIETGTDGIAKEQNTAIGDDNDEGNLNTEIKDETNIGNGEMPEVLNGKIDKTDVIQGKNTEESGCGIDDSAMGNKIEGGERMESNVDGDFHEQEKDVNNGVEEIKENSEGMIDDKEKVSQSESNEESENSENPEETVLHIVEDSDKNSLECEVNIVEQQEDIESHEKINSIDHEETDKPVEKHEDVQEEIDREKIKSFIEEVINDLQGIVIETEECDNIVEGLCLENESGDVNNLREGNFDMDLNVTENDDGNQNDQSETKECLDEAVNKSDGYGNDNPNNEKDPKDDSEMKSNDDKETADTLGEQNVLEKDESLEKEDVTKVSSGLLEHQNTTDVTKENNKTSEKHKKTTGTISKGLKEIAMIEEDLQGTRAALQASQSCLQNERAKHIQEVMRLKLLLYRSQTDLKHQRMKSDKQMTEIMSQLVLLESRLRREKKKVKSELKNKDDVIEIQKKEIVKLKDQNVQLLNAIKEICANGGMNGYMRENKRKNGNYSDGFDGKGGRGKLGTMKDKFMAKNRSSMELSNINLEKYLIKNERMCSSQEDLQRAVEDERRRSIPNSDTNFNGTQRLSISPVERPLSDGIEYKNGKHRKNPKYHHQNFFNDSGSPNYEMNKSVSESSHLSESTNSSSGVYSLSEHDLSVHDIMVANGHPFNQEQDDDDGDDRIFSFSSTHINTVINEEEALGPIMSHSGQMMSMGSMPMLANLKDEHRLGSGKDRPHSLSSVDLISIQQQAKHLEKLRNKSSPLTIPVMEMNTPPASPSSHNKQELTPFQTFKTMFRRSKNKGHKKRSVSLSQTTNTEYSEALKKHFQKYDMS